MAIKDFNRADLWFTSDGDFLIDASGDLRDTSDSGDELEGLKQQILHRVLGEQNAWRAHRDVTAGLEQYIGRAIDDEMLAEMEQQIRAVLTSDQYLEKSDFAIQAIELVDGVVAFMIYVNAAGQEHPVLTMAYSISTGEVLRIR